MATYRKLIFTPSFDSQPSQTDRRAARNVTGGNSKHHKLSRPRTMTRFRFTQETPSSSFDIRSTEITPCFSSTMKTNYLLRFYSNMRTSQKSAVNLRGAPEAGTSQRAKPDARGGPSTDNFGFPPRDAQAADKMSQTKEDVLSTIKKMLEENRVIRERLLNLRQLSRSK